MFPYIRIPPIDPTSFWAGFLAATLLWWLVRQVRPLLAQMRASWKEKQETAQLRRASSLEEHHRQNMLRLAQGMHLAAPLFSLDEILVSPRLLAPPARLAPGEPPPPDDAVTLSLPYLPAWPELAAVYQAPTLSLAEAFSGEFNLVITGQAGSGKSVALGHLASQICRSDPEYGHLGETTPFLLHVADLNLPVSDPKDILNPIIDAVSEKAPVLDLTRLPNFVQYAFRNGQAVLMLDGLDELPREEIQKAAAYLDALLKAYPHTRVVATALPEYLDGLLALGFVPFTLMPWTSDHQQQFLERWGDVWNRFVAVEAWAQTGPENVDPLLLNAWLSTDNAGLTPLELTLKAWGAYAGDALGPGVLNSLESHLRRVSPAGIPPAALEMLAMQVSLTAQPVFDARTAREWVRSFEPPEEKPVEAEGEGSEASGETPAAAQKGKKQTVAAPKPGLLPKMADSGLLVPHLRNRMRFCHPVLGGYLAGRALTSYETGDKLSKQAPWCGQLLTMHYLAALGDATQLAETFLSASGPPLEGSLFIPARWLRDAPRQTPWRGKVLAALARLMQSEGLPLGLRGQAATAILSSRDPGSAALFRQFMQVLTPETIRLAALGGGAMRDGKAVEPLSELLRSSDFYIRRAACLALVAIGSNQALEAVASALLTGDEDLRRAAAEALANDAREGHPTLQDGVHMDDILVRRAAVYGLGRVREDWALEVLKKVQVEDSQWVVKSAASEMVEHHTRPNPHLPHRLTPPSDTPWLIAFAGSQGLGISPGAPATDVLCMALKNGSPEERLAVLPYLSLTPDKGIASELYQAMYSGDTELREAAFQTIYSMATSGFTPPDPREFGLG